MNLAVSGSLGLYVGRFGGVASYVSRDTCAKGGEGSASITPSHLGRQGVIVQPTIVPVRGWVAIRVAIGEVLGPKVVTFLIIQGRVSPHTPALAIGPVNQVATVSSQAGSQTGKC